MQVTTAEYNFGDLGYTPPGFPGPVEFRANVHYPTGLSGGPHPLIVFLHGRHVTCYQGSAVFLEWPCRSGHAAIPSYTGYDYIASNLASYGYIVVSMSANGISAVDNTTSDKGALARAQLVQHHLDLWKAFNSASGGAPFGTTFSGKVDLTKVGTMGHSRGGEGVVRQFIYNASQPSPYGIKAVLPLAPVDFSRPVINGVPLSVILPYCDGDVSDLQGVHYYDDARYNIAGDRAPKHTVYVLGANHDFFNTIWTTGVFAGGADDWLFSGPSSDPQCGQPGSGGRLTAAEQQSVGLAYVAGFFREYIGSETALIPMFTGAAAPPASVGNAKLFVSYHAPNTATLRRDVNRLLAAPDLTTDTPGGAVSQQGITPSDLCGGDPPEQAQCLASFPAVKQPHTAPSVLSTKTGLSQLRAGWTATTAFFDNALPSGSRDVSGFEAVQFRVGVNFSDSRNPTGAARDFDVELTDGTGAKHVEHVSTFSQALFFPPGSSGPLPKVFLNSVRIPLSAYASASIKLTDVRNVRLMFDRSTSGAILVTDLAFASGALSG
jgi:hypothetical protein